MRVCESGKEWYFYLSVGKSGKGGKEWVGAGRSGLSSLNHEKNRTYILHVFWSNVDLASILKVEI